jgi:hypothetical protein
MEGRPHRLALKPFDKASGNDSYLRIPAVHRAVFERPPAQARD